MGFIHRLRIAIFLLPVVTVMLGCGNGDNPIEPPTSFAALSIGHEEILSSYPDCAYDVQLAVSPITGEVFCCWCKKIDGTPEIHWRHGQPGAFGPEEIITLVDGYKSFNPALKAGPDGRVHFAYMNKMPDGHEKEIFARTWNEGTWTPEFKLSDPDIWTGWDPEIATYPDGRFLVVWFDHRFNVQHEILLRVGDGHGSWEPYERMTIDNHWQASVDVDIDSNSVLHFSYTDMRHIENPGEWEDNDHTREGRNLEIYYRNWDGLFLGPEIRITNSLLRSNNSHISVDDQGVAHLIYVDETELGYYRLYHTTIESNQMGDVIAISGVDRRCDLSDIVCFGNHVYIAYVEYMNLWGSPIDASVLYIREILADGSLGTRLPVATTGTNLYPKLVADPTRNMLWIIWTEYIGDDETLRTGETSTHLCGVNVD